MDPLVFLAISLVLVSILGFFAAIAVVIIKAQKRKEKRKERKSKRVFVSRVGEGDESGTSAEATGLSTESTESTGSSAGSTGTSTETTESTGSSTGSTGSSTETGKYVGDKYTGNAKRIIIEPIHGLPVRHNVQKTCNIRIAGDGVSRPSGWKRLTIMSHEGSFEIPQKTLRYDENGEPIFNGWKDFHQSMANMPLNTEAEWKDNDFKGALNTINFNEDYVYGGCFEHDDIQIENDADENDVYVSVINESDSKNVCTIVSPNMASFDLDRENADGELLGSLTIEWKAVGEKVQVGSAVLHNDAEGGDTEELLVTIMVEGTEYETFGVMENEDEFLSDIMDSGVDTGVVKHHYRISHDSIAKAGNLLDVIKDGVLNVRVVFHEFSPDEEKIKIARQWVNTARREELINDEGSWTEKASDLLRVIDGLDNEVIYYLKNVEISASNIGSVLDGQIDNGEMNANLLTYITESYKLNDKANAKSTMILLLYIALPYIVDSFHILYFSATLSDDTTNDEALNSVNEIFNNMLTDDFLAYVKTLYKKSCENWLQGQNVEVNIVGVHAHSGHKTKKISEDVITFDEYSESLQRDHETKDCSWFSTKNLVFRDLYTFPMFSPNEPLCTDDSVWHVALHVRSMSSPATAHVSDIFYSDTWMLSEYMYHKATTPPNGAIEDDRVLTHEIGHAFGFHDVYNYDTVNEVQLDEDTYEYFYDVSIMHSSETVTATDRALMKLVSKLRGVDL